MEHPSLRVLATTPQTPLRNPQTHRSFLAPEQVQAHCGEKAKPDRKGELLRNKPWNMIIHIILLTNHYKHSFKPNHFII